MNLPKWLYTLALFAASPLAVPSEAGVSVAAWRWTRDIPAEVSTSKPAAHRTAKDLEAAFRHAPLVRDVLAHLGKPEGFSLQGVHSRGKGTANDASQGGTLRFLLANGEELHVWTGDLVHVHTALRWSRKGKATLVFK